MPVSASSPVLLGDGTESAFSAQILDDIVKLVVASRELGSLYAQMHQAKALQAELSGHATNVRTELLRFARQAELGLRATAQESQLAQVRTEADRIVDSLLASMATWRTQYDGSNQEELRNLEAQFQRHSANLRQSALQEIGQHARTRACTLVRTLDGETYTDRLEVAAFQGLRVQAPTPSPSPSPSVHPGTSENSPADSSFTSAPSAAYCAEPPCPTPCTSMTTCFARRSSPRPKSTCDCDVRRRRPTIFCYG